MGHNTKVQRIISHTTGSEGGIVMDVSYQKPPTIYMLCMNLHDRVDIKSAGVASYLGHFIIVHGIITHATLDGPGMRLRQM